MLPVITERRSICASMSSPCRVNVGIRCWRKVAGDLVMRLDKQKHSARTNEGGGACPEVGGRRMPRILGKMTATCACPDEVISKVVYVERVILLTSRVLPLGGVVMSFAICSSWANWTSIRALISPCPGRHLVEYPPCSARPSMTFRIPNMPPGRAIWYDKRLETAGLSQAGFVSVLLPFFDESSVSSATMAVDGLTLLGKLRVRCLVD